MRRMTVGTSLLVLRCLAGQTPSAPPAFEVASIKPNAQDDHRVFVQMLPGGGLRTTGTTVQFLLSFAYNVRSFQISGGPGWVNSDRFDILAKSDRGAGSDITPDDPRIDSSSPFIAKQRNNRSMPW